MKRTSFRRAAAPAAAIVALSVSLTACGGDNASGSDISGNVAVDGSSTVFPMSQFAAELFQENSPNVKVAVASSGTGGGFEKFCKGETDISDASRPIKTDEATEAPACKKAGIEYTELLVATDALTVVAHKDLAVDCLTTEQLIKLWEPGSKVDNWSDLDPKFPNEKITLFGPDTESGTYDYLAADVIEHESEKTRDDYQPSPNDDQLVEGVSGTKGATGYFGYTYFEQNQDKLKALEINDGNGCVAPSAESAQAGEYTPLSRPLFIYVANKAYTEKESVKAYVDYYVANLETIASEADYIPLSDELYAETKTALEGLSS